MEEQNELMETENVEVEENEETSSGSGIAMLIGSGLTLAVMAGIKLGKMLWAKYKTKKEDSVKENTAETNPEDDDFETVEEE